MESLARISGRQQRTAPSIVSDGITFRDVTGVILAGGTSSRMGSNKALLPCQGGRFIEAIHRTLRQLFPEVVLITNTPELYDFLPCRTYGDIFANCGPLAGIHAALVNSTTPYIFTVACDMPFLNPNVIRMMAARRTKGDIVIADRGDRPEPLHAFYSRSCLPEVENMLRKGKRNIVSFFPSVRITHVGQEEIDPIDPRFHSFSNINTPGEYFAFRNAEKNQLKRGFSTTRFETNLSDGYLDINSGGG